MVGTSKVLTVSYGTFSCTLEGFDDPFSTMKMVAEYFRDLSAQDRFFGSEPPTPDVDMLYRIAQSGTPKRVAAEMQENGVVLRQSQETSLEAEHATPGLDAAAMEPAGAIPEAQVHAEAEAAFPEAPVAEETVAAETVAADFAEAGPDEALAADAHDETHDEAVQPERDDLPLPEDREEHEDLPAFAEDAADGPSAEAVSEGSEQPVAEQGVEEDSYDDADAIFAALEREEAADPVPEQPAEERETEAAVAAELDDDLAAALAEIEADAAAARSAPAADPLVFHARVGEPAAADDFEADLAAALADDETAEEATVPAPDTGEFRDTPVSETAEADTDASAQEDDDDGESDGSVQVRARRGETEEERAERRRQRRERRERKRREMLGLPLDDTDASDEAAIVDDMALAHEPAARDDTEAETPAPVASEPAAPQVAAEQADDEDEDERAAAALTEARRARAEKALRASDLAREEQAIERLLRSTNARMDRPESTRRANALRQLKAAVAATEAERRAVPGLERIRASRGDAFRADLDIARADPEIATGPATPGTARPAPLVLVSEQRIDRSARPAVSRRAEAEESGADAMASAGSFGEYAEAIGAESLADLLEAAAAYTSYVEGQPRFSRAQVISKLSDVAGAPDVSREAGLRGFGQLLREGKILRVQDGQFTISKSSRYASQQRSAAG